MNLRIQTCWINCFRTGLADCFLPVINIRDEIRPGETVWIINDILYFPSWESSQEASYTVRSRVSNQGIGSGLGRRIPCLIHISACGFLTWFQTDQFVTQFLIPHSTVSLSLDNAVTAHIAYSNPFSCRWAYIFTPTSCATALLLYTNSARALQT